MTYRCYEGMSHAFIQLSPILEPAREALALLVRATRGAFELPLL